MAPVVRFSLFQTAEREHVLLMTMHHIISDGWSLSVFLGELSVLYSSYHQHKESPLPELPIQYSDFARWQKDWLQGDVLKQHLDYWKKQLAGFRRRSTYALIGRGPCCRVIAVRHTFTVRKHLRRSRASAKPKA